MALRGTLKDFGIADIFQLIGHQGKSGVLTVSQKQQEVRVHFSEGNVVRALSGHRRNKQLLGQILLRAEVITQDQLEQALEIQKSSGRRIGDVLVEGGVIDRATIQAFYRLQTHETIYQLFLWPNGNYEFNSEEVVLFDDETPIRSENVLMEGFRQVDEWPTIRRSISSYGLHFDVLVDLDSLDAGEAGDDGLAEPDSGDDFDLDAAFGDPDEAPPRDPRLEGIGSNERKVFHLVTPERDVQKIIDLSRLGEFETCKALVTLINNGIIRASADQKLDPARDGAVGGGAPAARSSANLISTVIRFGLAAALLVGIIVASRALGFESTLLGSVERDGFASQALKTELARARLESIRRGLEVYRARFGSYPAALDLLDARGYIDSSDLSFPWNSAYYYEPVGEGYRLLRPLE